MRNDKEFYDLILQKHEQNRCRRARRRQALIVASSFAFCAVLLIVSGLYLSPDSKPVPYVAPSTTESVASSTTTTVTTPIGIGGADYLYFDRPFQDKFYPDGAFYSEDAVDSKTFYAWLYQFEHATEGGTRPKHEYTVYNMIHELNIPRETVERLCAERIATYREWGYPQDAIDEVCLTPQELEMIYTLTEAELYPYFVTNQTIAVKDKFYTPKWLYEHTAEEYIEEGITVAQVETAYQSLTPDSAPPEAKQYIFEQLQRMKNLG